MKEYEFNGMIFKLEQRFGFWRLTVIHENGHKAEFNFKTKTAAMEEILAYAEV